MRKQTSPKKKIRHDLLLRIPVPTHERLVQVAKREHRSVTAQINFVIEQALEKENA